MKTTEGCTAAFGTMRTMLVRHEQMTSSQRHRRTDAGHYKTGDGQVATAVTTGSPARNVPGRCYIKQKQRPEQTVA
jgi:hypothetical protein